MGTFNNQVEWRKFILAVIIVVGFFGWCTFASIYPPKLPGDVTGGIFSAFYLLIGAIGNHYFKSYMEAKQTNGEEKPNG